MTCKKNNEVIHVFAQSIELSISNCNTRKPPHHSELTVFLLHVGVSFKALATLQPFVCPLLFCEVPQKIALAESTLSLGMHSLASKSDCDI